MSGADGGDMVVAACTQCRAEWPVPGRYAGRTVTCRRCHALVTVPVPTVSVPVEPVGRPPSSAGRTAEQIIIPVPRPPADETPAAGLAAIETTPDLTVVPAARRWPWLAVVLAVAVVGGVVVYLLTRK